MSVRVLAHPSCANGKDEEEEFRQGKVDGKKKVLRAPARVSRRHAKAHQEAPRYHGQRHRRQLSGFVPVLEGAPALPTPAPGG